MPSRREKSCWIWTSPTCCSKGNKKRAFSTATMATIFYGEHLLCARLWPSNQDASASARRKPPGSRESWKLILWRLFIESS
jgi:hypothetical protein